MVLLEDKIRITDLCDKMTCVNCLTWPPANKHMLESKSFKYVRLYQIDQSDYITIYYPSIIAKKMEIFKGSLNELASSLRKLTFILLEIFV